MNANKFENCIKKGNEESSLIERLPVALSRMQPKESLIREYAVNGICDIALVLFVIGLHIVVPV